MCHAIFNVSPSYPSLFCYINNSLFCEQHSVRHFLQDVCFLLPVVRNSQKSKIGYVFLLEQVFIRLSMRTLKRCENSNTLYDLSWLFHPRVRNIITISFKRRLSVFAHFFDVFIYFYLTFKQYSYIVNVFGQCTKQEACDIKLEVKLEKVYQYNQLIKYLYV